MKKVCKIEGCGRKHYALGYCSRHRNRFLRYGDPLGGKAFAGAKMQWIIDHIGYLSEDCLFWPFDNNADGYGEVYIDGERIKSTRFICTLAHGDPPTPLHQSAHSCGNPTCRNHRHLRWATQSENQLDRVAHGTDMRGEKHTKAKLTRADVTTIRAERGKITQESLAERFGVTKTAIKHVQAGRSWGWLQVTEAQ